MKQYNIFGELEEIDDEGNVIRNYCEWCNKPMTEEKDCCSLECAEKVIQKIFEGLTGNI